MLHDSQVQCTWPISITMAASIKTRDIISNSRRVPIKAEGIRLQHSNRRRDPLRIWKVYHFREAATGNVTGKAFAPAGIGNQINNHDHHLQRAGDPEIMSDFVTSRESSRSEPAESRIKAKIIPALVGHSDFRPLHFESKLRLLVDGWKRTCRSILGPKMRKRHYRNGIAFEGVENGDDALTVTNPSLIRFPKLTTSAIPELLRKQRTTCARCILLHKHDHHP